MTRQPRRTAGAVTVHDVAQHAGVSPMTVSRVINNDAAVRPQTRKRVEASIRVLGYRPNPNARALSGRVPAKVALLHRFPSPIHLGEFAISLLEVVARAHVDIAFHRVSDPSDVQGVMKELAIGKVRGVILTPPLADDAALVLQLKTANIAVVATGAMRAERRLPWVGIDDRHAASAMTEHLLSLGHRRIGFIKGVPGFASAEVRFAGYVAALAAAGLEVDEDLVTSGEYDYRSGAKAAERLLSHRDPPTAIFASNDEMAAATVAVAHRRGLGVPDDVSVCGFDDTVIATTIFPELTTIRRPTDEITHIAVDLLIASIGKPPRPGGELPHMLLDYELIRRESAGPPRPR
nr:LacI family DNA-binding transcriptional regulator [Sphingomonas nostoxanthinifaciens]